ncbi:hypothetical protein KVT40_001671 [Elsinoe batatas]|uniref:Uncharacterized protein n=1 Tax=Elsinoe batatas TaxID=2601811 RepID=A0A8K0L6E0_9PEZI|nr:hypothetical protein KVT40_001671 [Elsinoe batatas]
MCTKDAAGNALDFGPVLTVWLTDFAHAHGNGQQFYYYSTHGHYLYSAPSSASKKISAYTRVGPLSFWVQPLNNASLHELQMGSPDQSATSNPIAADTHKIEAATAITSAGELLDPIRNPSIATNPSIITNPSIVTNPWPSDMGPSDMGPSDMADEVLLAAMGSTSSDHVTSMDDHETMPGGWADTSVGFDINEYLNVDA